MNKRHAFFKACRQIWWELLNAAIILPALAYFFYVEAAPWWFFAVAALVVVTLTIMQVVDSYEKIRRDHFHF